MDHVLDDVFEEVAGDQEAHQGTQEAANVDDWNAEEEAIELGLEDLAVGVAKHDDRVRDWNCKDDREA